MYKSVIWTLALFIVIGCSTVTIRPKGSSKLSSIPQYEDRKDFFFWGLVGEHSVNVDKACGGKRVRQMQTQQTFVDGLLGAITLGIYYPRTAKVWCGGEE